MILSRHLLHTLQPTWVSLAKTMWVSQVVRNFVSTELGSHYIVSPDFDLVGCFKEIYDFVEPSLWAGAGCVSSIKGIQMEYLHTTDHVHSLSPEIRVKHKNKNA